MYVYLYDSYLSGKKHASTLAKVEVRLGDLGIGGRIHRLSPLKDVGELVRDEVRSRVRTVVAVGDDATLSHVINVVGHQPVTLGYIPIPAAGQVGHVAASLGLAGSLQACDVLSARRVVGIDLGLVNDVYFIDGLTLPPAQVSLGCDGRYDVKLGRDDRVSVANLRPAGGEVPGGTYSPTDGKLEVLVQPAAKRFGLGRKQPAQPSVFTVSKLEIKSPKPVAITVDGKQVVKTPAEVAVKRRMVKMVVGKGRRF